MAAMSIEEVIRRLAGVVPENYQWPAVPAGWRLEFIAFSNAEVAIDILHPVSGVFWSEDNGYLDPPLMMDGRPITATALQKAGVPFMTTFGVAKVSDEKREPHLAVPKSVK